MGDILDVTASLDAAFHMPTYARKMTMFVRGIGMRLYDDEGREHLDFVAGIGSVNLGHAHPAVAMAVIEQIGTLVHVSNLYHVQHRGQLARDLISLFGHQGKVFFCNSGTEAVEGAIKLARRWGKARRGDACVGVVTAERSFHGRTLAALSATGQPSKQDAFAPLVPGFAHVPLNDVAAMDAAVGPDTCAVLLEPIQGEGGVYPCEPGYLEQIRKLCDEREVLLMLDEVQTGLYRTGPAFAHQAYGVVPDVMCLAKSLANGLPMGALVARGSVADTFQPGDHGSTFGGGPVLCAAARACIRALADERLGEKAASTGAHLRSRLRALADETGAIGEVRGAGLMNAIELVDRDAAEVAARLLQHGLVVNNIGTSVLRMLPPLVCGHNEVDALVDVLRDVLVVDTGGA